MSPTPLRRSFLPTATIAALLTHSPAFAAPLTWDAISGNGTLNDGGGIWNTSLTNWTSDSGVSNTTWNNATPDAATFGGGSTGSAGTVTLGGNITAAGVTFNAPNGGGAYILDTSTNILTLGGILVANSNTTINGNLQFTGFGIEVHNNSTLTINANSANSTGSGNVFKGGNGTLVLSGTNSLLNGINVLQVALGTVRISSDNNLGDDFVQLGAGNGSGTLEYTGSGGTIDNVIRIGNPNATATGGGSILNTGSGTLTFSATTFNMQAATTATRNVTFGGSSDIVISGGIQNNNTGAVSVTKAALSSNTVYLSGVNTYTGATSVDGGTLVFANKAARSSGTTVAAAAAGTVGLGVGAGGITDYSGADVTALFNTNTLAGFNLNASSGVALDTAAGNFTLNTNLTASRALTKLGANTLTLSGTNSYNGATAVNGGTLLFANKAARSSATTVTAAAAGTVGLGVGAGGVTDYSGADVTALFNTNTLTGFNLNASSGVALDTTAGNFTLNTDLTANRALTKLGANTLTLSGTNPYNGGTVLNNGTINITNVGALGTGNLTMNENGAGDTVRLDFAGVASGGTFSNNIIQSNLGDNKFLAFNLTGTSSTIELTGTLSLNDTDGTYRHIIDTTNDIVTISGLVSGSAGTDVRGAGGKLKLTNDANSFGAATGNGRYVTIRFDGTVEVTSLADAGQNSALGRVSEIRLGGENNPGTLSYIGATNAQTDRQILIGGVNDAAGTGGAIIVSNGIGILDFDNAAFNIVAAGHTQGRTLTLGGTNSGDNTIRGVIANNSALGTVALAKSDAGKWILSGANTYTGGTTVNGGTLLVNNTTGSGTGTGAVNVIGGILGGSGTINGAVTVSSGAIHSAGNVVTAANAAGTGTVGNQVVSSSLSYSSGSIFEWNLTGNTETNEGTRGTDYDAINTASLDSTTGAIFRVVLNGSQNFGESFWESDREWADIFTNVAGDTALSIASIFSGGIEYFNASGALASPATTQGSFTISGTSLTWTAVPEPTTALAGVLLGAGLLRRRRA